MRVASSFSPKFIEGFVTECQRLGFDCDKTETLFRKHANMTMLAHPEIQAGLREKLASYEGPVSKAFIARAMGPEVMALAEECRIKWGSDVLSQQIRARVGLPEPSWDTVPEGIRKTAMDLSNSLTEFDHLPMNQKILLASLLGGGFGGGVRSLSPTLEDRAFGRGLVNRGVRGAARGALTGMGAAVGAGAGSQLANTMGEETGEAARLPSMLLGGTLGGIGGYRLGA